MYSPVEATAATGFFPLAVACRYRNSGEALAAVAVSTLLFSSFAVEQLRMTCTGTEPAAMVGTATVIWVGVAAKIGAFAPPKVTHKPAKLLESEPPPIALICAPDPSPMNFDP